MKRDPRGIPWHWTYRGGKIVSILYMQPEDWDRFTKGLPPRPHGGYEGENRDAKPASPAAIDAGMQGPDDQQGLGYEGSTGRACGPGLPDDRGANPGPTPSKIKRGGLPAQPDLL